MRFRQNNAHFHSAAPQGDFLLLCPHNAVLRCADAQMKIWCTARLVLLHGCTEAKTSLCLLHDLAFQLFLSSPPPPPLSNCPPPTHTLFLSPPHLFKSAKKMLNCRLVSAGADVKLVCRLRENLTLQWPLRCHGWQRRRRSAVSVCF